jgi:tRNA dimethylallyltransferase
MSDSTIYKVHVVAGPTAAGKTDYALALAEKLNGELINIDSRQVYKYMDIGTNKGQIELGGTEEIFAGDYPVHKFSNGIHIHLLSFLEPSKQFNIYDFRALVYDLIPKIARRGKTPILVGGSGLYLSAILYPDKYKLSNEKFNPQYRSQLELMSVGELQSLLTYYSQVTFAELNPSDRQNKRRLIRKIETLTGDGEIRGQISLTLNIEPQLHLIHMPIEELTEKINARVITMFEQGFVEEVKGILEKGYSSETPALRGIGYSQVIDFLQRQGIYTLEQCISAVQVAHRQYAKRQMTWFKKYL